jgi:DNA-binding response OmpR family regulator
MNNQQSLPACGPAGAPLQSQTNLPHRILVVDDDGDIRSVATKVLKRSGYEADAAENGAVAWDTLQKNTYHLLITDHSMPKVTGIELVKKVRSARMALPVILVTGVIPTEELNRHPWLQLAATLLKPFTVEELLQAVEGVLRATYGPRAQIAPPPN